MTRDESLKIIEKPWGREKWLELGRYCLKELFLRAGNRTSLQYHNKKIETMYFLKGTARVFVRDLKGGEKNLEMKAGRFITIHPGEIHRVSAVTDTTYVEASTTEVDDLVRIEDDYSRKED